MNLQIQYYKIYVILLSSVMLFCRTELQQKYYQFYFKFQKSVSVFKKVLSFFSLFEESSMFIVCWTILIFRWRECWAILSRLCFWQKSWTRWCLSSPSNLLFYDYMKLYLLSMVRARSTCWQSGISAHVRMWS